MKTKMEQKEQEMQEMQQRMDEQKEQVNQFQQLQEEEEGRKKKFMLVKSKYEQELEEANKTIQTLQNTITSVSQS